MLFVRPSCEEGVRLGVAASNRAGNNVMRNRLKRVLREAAGRLAPGWKSGLDVVLMAKASAAGHGLADIEKDLEVVAARAGLRPDDRDALADVER